MNKHAGLNNLETFLFMFVTLLFFLLFFVSADVISVNPAGSTEHAQTPEKYIEGFFFGHNTAPSVSNVILNSTSGNNLTTDNLTVYYSASDSDLDDLTNITDWRKDGQSIAVLNMPFDTRVTSTDSGAVRDYSTYENNGTLGGGTSAYAPTWTSDGKIGGAYEFDGSNDYISVLKENSLNFSTEGFSISGWVYVLGEPNAPFPGFIEKSYGDFSNTPSNQRGFYLSVGFYSSPTRSIRWCVGNGSGYDSVTYSMANSDLVGKWNYVTAVVDSQSSSTPQLKLYVNGTLVGSTSRTYTGSIDYDKNLDIGRWAQYGRYFNGSIDEVQIFNYSLSPEQINAMYLAGVANHSVEEIVSDETSKGDTWQVAVTPNDAYEDGETVLSNELTIENTPPNTPTLISPPDENVTTNRTPTFFWSGSDDDGDALTYELNLTVGGSCTCSDDRHDIDAGSNDNYTIENYLLCLKDNGCYYNWTVRAYDGLEYSSWASPWKLEIQASLEIIMINDTINFGSMGMEESKNTTTNSPYPFSLQNDGNCFANVSINATQLWNTIDSASDTYRFKADNYTEEPGAFEWLSSGVSWNQMPLTGQTIAISKFDFNDTKDVAEVDILVTVPNQEPSGDRESTVYFPVSLGE